MCEMSERSARGYCPDEVEGHEEELCAFGEEFEDASFCSGPSDQGSVSCEDDGSCDDSFTGVCTEQGLVFDYELGGCWKEEVAVATVDDMHAEETLPNAGFDVVAILLIANVLGLIGLRMIFKEHGHGR